MPVTPRYDEWTSGGQPYSLTTNPLEGETQQRVDARHDEAMEFWDRTSGVYPKDPE